MNTLSPVLSTARSDEHVTTITVVPYVVSADIRILLSQWASRRGFILPEQGFFTDLRAEFSRLMQRVFPEFVFISEQEMAEGLREKTASARHPLLSLERAYLETPFKLEVSRCVDEHNADAGLYSRNGAPRLHAQLTALRAANVLTVSVVDDVIFSGGFLLRILELLEKTGIEVAAVYTGIAIGSGIGKVRAAGYRVECVRFFPEVVDEVCERDFFPGVPLSGRTLRGAQNIGIPYILPFGLMDKWASISGEHEKSVSKRCVDLTVMLFDEIDRVSGRPVLCSDLERGVLGIASSAVSFSRTLERFVR